MNKAEIRARTTAATIAVCAILLAVFGIMATLAVRQKCATQDEIGHLGAAWAETHSMDFRCDIDNPVLWKYYIAIGTNLDDLHFQMKGPEWDSILGNFTIPEKMFIKVFYRTPQNNPDKVLTAARNRMIFLGIAVGALIVWWAWRLAGKIAAIVAVVAFCFDPNFLAHSPLVKNDMPITLLFVALMAFIWLLGERATVGRWLGVSLFLGAALTTKYTGLFTIPILGLALLCRVLLSNAWPTWRWSADTRLRRLCAAVIFGTASLFVAYVLVWSCYLFRFSVGPNPDEHLELHPILVSCAKFQAAAEHHPIDGNNPAQVAALMARWHPGIVIRSLLWAIDHHVLPESWLVGFLSTYGDTQSRNSFLCGQFSSTGWWYYFPAAMLFKTPVATLIALILATGILVALAVRQTNSKNETPRDWWPLCAVVIAPVFYMAMAMQSHLNIGIRHILVVYPFLYIFIGVMFARARTYKPKLIAAVAGILAIGLVVETFAAFPNYISFFNVACGGARSGLKLLGNSNLDWGQDLPLAEDWQKQHPDRPLCLLYSGSIDPAYYNIRYFKTSSQNHFPTPQQAIQMHAVFGLSATILQGTYLSPHERIAMQELAKKTPLAVLGGTIYLYEWK